MATIITTTFIIHLSPLVSRVFTQCLSLAHSICASSRTLPFVAPPVSAAACSHSCIVPRTCVAIPRGNAANHAPASTSPYTMSQTHSLSHAPNSNSTTAALSFVFVPSP